MEIMARKNRVKVLIKVNAFNLVTTIGSLEGAVLVNFFSDSIYIGG